MFVCVSLSARQKIKVVANMYAITNDSLDFFRLFVFYVYLLLKSKELNADAQAADMCESAHSIIMYISWKCAFAQPEKC